MLTPPRVSGQLGDPNEWVNLRGLPFLGRTKSKSRTVDLFSKTCVPNKHNFNILYNNFYNITDKVTPPQLSYLVSKVAMRPLKGRRFRFWGPKGGKLTS